MSEQSTHQDAGAAKEPQARQREKTYSEEEIRAKLAEIPGWYYEDGWIRRQYKTDGWATTMMLVNTIGYVCEAAYHHPDLNVTWAKVWVKFMTHSAGGITDKDFYMARQVERAVMWKPEAGAPLGGNPNKWVRGGDPR